MKLPADDHFFTTIIKCVNLIVVVKYEQMSMNDNVLRIFPLVLAVPVVTVTVQDSSFSILGIFPPR
jgi:hypothetical protein